MVAQTIHNQSSDQSSQPLTSDRVSWTGRVVTMILFATVLCLLVLTFYWIGARRFTNFFVSKGDEAYLRQAYPAAVSDYTWALRFSSDDAHALLNRGYALQKVNNHAAAVNDFAAYIALRPQDATGYRSRGLSYARLGKSQQAIADLTEQLIVSPRMWSVSSAAPKHMLVSASGKRRSAI